MCDSTLRAVDHANKKSSRGYKSTGVGAVVCARHGLVRKNGLGDLQKGERCVSSHFGHGYYLPSSRYANMDFIVLYTLIGVTILLLVLSYDIICQWATNFKLRIPQFPSFMRIPPEIFVIIKYVIPKFHIYGHGARCQYRFSLNFLRWSARTNGEEPERWWAHINPISMSTKEMSPGSRTDVIDDHAGAWNFRKITGFGE
jgi:Kyakuja-Dileera-Zisupton transposase